MLLFSVFKIFMSYFEWVMELAEESRLGTFLISCTMALVVILNVQSGRAFFYEVERRMTNRRINARLVRYPSPIHITSSKASRRQLRLPLVWTHYDDTPLAMLLENNGSTVILRSFYPPNSVPCLSGAELGGSYHFVEAIFKWGVTRTEHSLDGQQFSLELQVLHLCPQRKEYLALSYLFSQHRFTNDPLKQITGNLRCIQWQGSSIELPPFELGTLLRSFDRGYYSYQGTYDNGVIELPVTWLIDPQIGNVRHQQVAEFAALCGKEGSRITSNARLEKSLGRRSVQFHY